MDHNEARLRIAYLCSSLADVTGDGRFARAAGMLRGGRAGRKAADDADLLALAQSLIATGMSARSACKLVAQFSAPDCRVSAVAARLRNKLAKN